MLDQAANLRKKVKEKNLDNSRIITIASGKGGVGKTNIAVNLGLALNELGVRILLLDADIGMANIDVLLDLENKYNLSHVIRGECSMEEAIKTAPGGIDILPGITGIDEWVDMNYQQIFTLLDASSHMEEKYDIILIDIGAGGHRSVINFINAGDEAIIVLTPEPTAIMDAYSLIKIMDKYHYNNKLDLLINMVNSGFEGEEVIKRMKKVIREYLEMEVELLGYIPYDSTVRQSVKKQQAVLSYSPTSKAGQSYKKIAANLLDKKQAQTSRGMKGFIYRMLGMFNRNLREG